MELRVKDLDIHTGGPFIAILNEKDATKLDIHYGDRILLRHNDHRAIAVADVTHHPNTIKQGQIGLMEELERKLNAEHGAKVRISIIPKPTSTTIIKKKMAGSRLSYKEFYTIISEVVANHLTESELAAFVTACFIHELTDEEVVSLCKAMVATGERLTFRSKYVMDLHCIGGVPGNRTTMVVVPIIAAAGLIIPKTSSRAITSPSGTADTVETLCSVSMDGKKLSRIVRKVGGVMVWGGALNLAPADDKIIRVEHPLNIDAEGQMIASVMAKKYAVGSTHVLLDIPVGRMAKVQDRSHANRLKARFERVGRSLGIRMRIILTDGSQPIGNGIGPALEALDVLKIMRGEPNAPADLREKSLEMAGSMLEMANKAPKGEGYEMARHLLHSGAALKKWNQMLDAQGRSPRRFLWLGKCTRVYRAKKSGKVSHIDAHRISRTAKEAGAPKDYGAGVFLHKHLGDPVKKGDPLVTVYAHNPSRLKHATDGYKAEDFCRVR